MCISLTMALRTNYSVIKFPMPNEVVNSHLSLYAYGSHCISAVDIDYSFRRKGMNTYGYIIINPYI